ncbi:MAG: hypothetical protein ACTTHG_08050 [Treponemataceae bacterium]
MKLIKAHIINFGKLHDLKINFNDGLNSYIHENGWGKTTLSIFIKAMLYGLEYTSSKDPEKNEKLKYFPWQGGVYGGNLTFSCSGKEYTVSRTFGLKKNEDTFELRNEKTNKISSDFTSELGNQIFGVNRETFSRSIHIVLSETPEGSADICAGLNNLIEAGDISNFDIACKNIDDRASLLKAKRGKTGEIYQIAQIIDHHRNFISEIEAKILQNEEYERKIKDINSYITGLKASQQELTEQISLNAKYESKIRYEQLKKDLHSAEKLKEELLEFFCGNIPDENIIKKIDSILNDLITVESNIKNFSLFQSEKDKYEILKNYFAADIPSKNQIENCLKIDNEYKLFKQIVGEKKLSPNEMEQFSVLRQRFENSNISESIITDCLNSVVEVQNKKTEIAQLKSELQAKQEHLNEEKRIKPKNIKRILFFSLASVAFIAGIVVFFLKFNIIIQISCLFSLLLFFVLGIFSKNKLTDFSDLVKDISDLQEKIKKIEFENDKKENEQKSFVFRFGESNISEIAAINKIGVDFKLYSTFLEKSKNYEMWLKNQPKTFKDYENELKVFCKRFCKSDDISNIPSEIQILNEKLSCLNELEQKINSDSMNNQLRAEKIEKLSMILSQYKTEKTFDFALQVQEVHNKINDIKNAESLISANKKRLLDFENSSEHDIKSFDTLNKPAKNVDELHEKLNEISEQITSKNALVSTYQKIINDNLTYTERKNDIETELDRFSMQKKEKESEYSILQKTLEMLAKAKENLDANYGDPIKVGFSKYVKMLGGNLNLIIDTDLKVYIEESGKRYESEFLSGGYKDLVNFCSRMALIDALFVEEKPPVIIDDPFVNLDDDKLEKAISFIKILSKEKQILYFACHKSRNVL